MVGEIDLAGHPCDARGRTKCKYVYPSAIASEENNFLDSLPVYLAGDPLLAWNSELTCVCLCDGREILERD